MTPFLAIPRAKEAVAFYQEVFGARVIDMTEMGGGVVVHAVLDIGHGHLQVGEPMRSITWCRHRPATTTATRWVSTGGTPTRRRPRHHRGATVREPLTNFVSRDRFASIRDPFGVRWSVMTRVEDLSNEESMSRVAAWAAQQEAERG